jgi:hypothetical protein
MSRTLQDIQEHWGTLPGMGKEEFRVLCENTKDFCERLDPMEYNELQAIINCGEQVLYEVGVSAGTTDVAELIKMSIGESFQTVMDNLYYTKLAADYWETEISRIWSCGHADRGAGCLKACIVSGLAMNVFQSVEDDIEQEEFIEQLALTDAEEVGSEKRRLIIEECLQNGDYPVMWLQDYLYWKKNPATSQDFLELILKNKPNITLTATLQGKAEEWILARWRQKL